MRLEEPAVRHRHARESEVQSPEPIELLPRLVYPNIRNIFPAMVGN